MVFVFDIDGTLLNSEYIKEEERYALKGIKINMLEIVNKLYEQGHTIILQTARHWDKFQATKQMVEGFHYHSLVMGNIPADYYINDKNLTPEGFIDLFETILK